MLKRRYGLIIRELQGIGYFSYFLYLLLTYYSYICIIMSIEEVTNKEMGFDNMRRPKKITTETIDKLNKTVDRIEFLKEKIRKANEEIKEIQEENGWINYLSKEMYSELTDEQNIKFAELIIKIAKADKN